MLLCSATALQAAWGGDPFVGCGTVALSCHRHGRRFIGGDLGRRERDGRNWADVVNEQLAQTNLFHDTSFG